MILSTLLLLPLCIGSWGVDYIYPTDTGVTIFIARSHHGEADCYNYDTLLAIGVDGAIFYKGANVDVNCKSCHIFTGPYGLPALSIEEKEDYIYIRSYPAFVTLLW